MKTNNQEPVSEDNEAPAAELGSASLAIPSLVHTVAQEDNGPAAAGLGSAHFEIGLAPLLKEEVNNEGSHLSHCLGYRQGPVILP